MDTTELPMTADEIILRLSILARTATSAALQLRALGMLMRYFGMLTPSKTPRTPPAAQLSHMPNPTPAPPRMTAPTTPTAPASPAPSPAQPPPPTPRPHGALAPTLLAVALGEQAPTAPAIQPATSTVSVAGPHPATESIPPSAPRARGINAAMPDDDPGRPVPADERARLRTLWHGTRLLAPHPRTGAWLPWSPPPGKTLLVITAWNPDAHPASAADNARADNLLHTQVARLNPLRIRGAGDGWHEDGLAIPHDPERSLMLIRRYRQAAAWVVTADGRRLLWRDGLLDEA